MHVKAINFLQCNIVHVCIPLIYESNNIIINPLMYIFCTFEPFPAFFLTILQLEVVNLELINS